jgi:hypothetical protein
MVFSRISGKGAKNHEDFFKKLAFLKHNILYLQYINNLNIMKV